MWRCALSAPGAVRRASECSRWRWAWLHCLDDSVHHSFHRHPIHRLPSSSLSALVPSSSSSPSPSLAPLSTPLTSTPTPPSLSTTTPSPSPSPPPDPLSRISFSSLLSLLPRTAKPHAIIRHLLLKYPSRLTQRHLTSFHLVAFHTHSTSTLHLLHRFLSHPSLHNNPGNTHLPHYLTLLLLSLATRKNWAAVQRAFILSLHPELLPPVFRMRKRNGWIGEV